MYAQKLLRKVQKIFGWESNPTEMVEFGTPTNGRAVYSKDPADIQTPYYEAGWFPESLSGNIRPYAEDMNGLHYVHSYQLAYLLQAGIPEWNAETPYFIDCIVRVGRVLYVSNTDNNLNNNPISDTSNIYWNILTLGDAGIPVGASIEWNSSTLPNSKWKFENGESLLVADYSELFAVIGYTFGGSGDYFNLPNSTGRVAIGYSSGTAGLNLGSKGGQFNHQHIVPAHYHGKGNLYISNSGSHTHAITDNGHLHTEADHQHLFRFGDYSAKQGSEVARLACLGSSGSGTASNPTKVTWNAQNGKEGYHFYKMVSKQVQNGGTINDVGAKLNTSQSKANITISNSLHSHDNNSLNGNIGAVNGSNADTGTMQTKSLDTNNYSSNMPFIVKRKIIRVKP